MKNLTMSLRVLVVDDNADAADLVAQYMAFQGYEVAVAHDGEEAVATARAFVPNLILLDLGMPGMDGYKVASTLRDADWFPPTRIVALTAWVTRGRGSGPSRAASTNIWSSQRYWSI